MRRLHLPLVDRFEACTEHFRQIGAAIDPEADDRGGQRIEPDADLGQAEIDDEQLGEHRNGAKHVDIDRDRDPERVPVEPLRNCEGQADQRRQDERARGDLRP